MSHVTVIRPDIRQGALYSLQSLTKMTAEGGSADSAVSPGLAADSTSRLGYCSLQTPGTNGNSGLERGWPIGDGEM